MNEIIPKEIFSRLEEKEVCDIVNKMKPNLSLVLVPDNTRRTGIIYNNLDSKIHSFERNLFDTLSPKFISLIETLFNHGVKTLFIPSLTHGNLDRNKQYVDSHFKYASRYILRENNWLNFYEENEIKVRLYGDLGFVEGLGYLDFLKWARRTEALTADNKKHTLFWGYACSASIENMRIVNLCIDFHETYGRKPTLQETRRLYYGEDVNEIDIFIRPGEIRDSDCQPPLLGGGAEMYFPVCPLTELNTGFFKEILYDYLFNRISSKGKKNYEYNLDFSSIQRMRNYYENNKDVIFGLGERIGELWIPSNRPVTSYQRSEMRKND